MRAGWWDAVAGFSAVASAVRSLALAVPLLLCANCPVGAETLDGQWREKNQLVWDETARQLVRKVIRVWDMEPDRNLEFYWDPAKGQSERAGGTIEGRGRLTWRRAGSANYERASIYSTYVGEMKDGRPNGHGRLELYTGTTYEGAWVAGLMDGEGTLRLTSGDVYTGEFRYGLMHGKGRYVAASGETYEGEFVRGERHGAGTVVSPKGERRSTLWAGGLEVGKQGLIQRVQARADMNDVTVSVTTDARKNTEVKDAGGLVLTYAAKVGPGEVAIVPDDERFMSIWKNGGQMYNLQEELVGELPDYSQAFYDAPAFIKVRIAKAGAPGASVKSLRLDVAASQSDRQPFLGVLSSLPDGLLFSDQPTGYDPTFSFVNMGWGAVADAKLTASFKAKGSASASPAFTLEVDSFDQLKRISVQRELQALGVDVTQLKSLDYTCPDVEQQLQACQEDVLSKLSLGGLRPNVEFLGGRRHLVTYVSGTLDYQWKDQAGKVHSSSSPFEVRIPLAEIKPTQPAEYSGPDLPSAGVPLFELTPDRRGYQLRYDLKSPPALNAIGRDFVLGLFAKKSSNHRLRVVAELTDGREIPSLPVVLTYARPRPMPETPDRGEEPADDAAPPAPAETPMAPEQQSAPSTNVGSDSSCEELWVARNQVFKDAGYCFATAKARNYFGNNGCRFKNQDDVPLGAEARSFVLQVRALEARKRC